MRVSPKLRAGTRSSSRQRGQSDAIDAAAVARAGLREPDLPEARLPGPERELRLLADHRLDLVAEGTRIQGRLRWHRHELTLALEVPAKALDRACWLARLKDELADREGVQARIARELTGRCCALTGEIDALEREIAQLTRVLVPALLALPGCGALTAACLVGETAGAQRFTSEAHFALPAGVAPLPAASGQTRRYRLNRRGNRQLNCALQRMAVTQIRMPEPAQVFLAGKRAEGKSTREALRCLKRHLARIVWRALLTAESRREAMLQPVNMPTHPALALAS